MRPLTAALLVFGAVLVPVSASADVQHVVGKGHTLQAIAHRYHVSTKAIMEANQLKDGKHLHAGDVLVIPKADTSKGKTDKTDGSGKKADGTVASRGAKAAPGKKDKEPTTYALKARTPGVVHIKRVASTEEADVRVSDTKGHGKVSPVALKSFEKVMRSPAGMAHPIDGRLISLVGVMSNHFGSRKVEIISGFRPYTPTQYTPHSNHNHGRAIDFRIAGVPNEAVRDFCRTLKNVGCGYYPNSTFVHMDTRDKATFWIDYSKPGEAPRYNAANLDADEGTSDVHDRDDASSNTAPAAPDAAPASELPGSTAPAAPATPAAPEESATPN